MEHRFTWEWDPGRRDVRLYAWMWFADPRQIDFCKWLWGVIVFGWLGLLLHPLFLLVGTVGEHLRQREKRRYVKLASAYAAEKPPVPQPAKPSAPVKREPSGAERFADRLLVALTTFFARPRVRITLTVIVVTVGSVVMLAVVGLGGYLLVTHIVDVLVVLGVVVGVVAIGSALVFLFVWLDESGKGPRAAQRVGGGFSRIGCGFARVGRRIAAGFRFVGAVVHALKMNTCPRIVLREPEQRPAE